MQPPVSVFLKWQFVHVSRSSSGLPLDGPWGLDPLAGTLTCLWVTLHRQQWQLYIYIHFGINILDRSTSNCENKEKQGKMRPTWRYDLINKWTMHACTEVILNDNASSVRLNSTGSGLITSPIFLQAKRLRSLDDISLQRWKTVQQVCSSSTMF